eukprot:CAMPEP_0115561082 /NCGR_PEP_ID=MMETSP0271-20121206/100801_1 /TAXON_ID=71861 /ORGANISM="Scrippsiella trochoidea, Strain CCMP3099" /LENGTH=46 /DNA_ID= /DNA_START= /DNA_END= /DNA_ORIENTATION=
MTDSIFSATTMTQCSLCPANEMESAWAQVWKQSAFGVLGAPRPRIE